MFPFARGGSIGKPPYIISMAMPLLDEYESSAYDAMRGRVRCHQHNMKFSIMNIMLLTLDMHNFV